jgi:hypothetical protein
VIEVAVPVEHHVFHAAGGSSLGDELAYHFGGADICAGLEARPHVLFERRSGRQGGAFARLAPLGLLGRYGNSLRIHPYFFLPSLRKMRSSAYFTPLPS